MATAIPTFSYIDFPFGISNSKEVNQYIPNSILAIGEQFPAMVTLQNFKTMANVYINEYGCKFLEHTKSELLAMGQKYYSVFFPLEEREHIADQLNNLEENIPDKSISFFQRIRPNENSEYSWFFTTSQLYLISQQRAVYLLNISCLLNKCSYMGQKLDSLVAENLFLKKYYLDSQHLSEREKEVMELIAKGNSSLKISKLLCISIHTVNNHRKNIIQKIGKKNLLCFIKLNSIFPSASI